MCFLFPSLFVFFSAFLPFFFVTSELTELLNVMIVQPGFIQWAEGSRVNGSEHDHHYHCTNIRRVSGGSIPIIRRNTQYSRWSILVILRTTQYFGGWIISILCTMQYFQGVDNERYSCIQLNICLLYTSPSPRDA